MPIKFFNFKNISITNVKNIFIFFFVISLVFSRFLADLYVVAGAFSFIFLKIKKNIKINSNIFFYFLFFYIYLIFSSFFSAVPFESLKSTLPYIRFICFVFFIVIYFSDRASLKTLLYSLLFVYFILLVDGILQTKTGFNLFGYQLDSSGRVSSFFGRHLILGSFVSKTFVIAIFLIFYLDIKYKYIAYFGTIIISALLVYISRERASLFVYLACLFFSFFLIERKYFFRTIFLVIFQIFLLILLYQQPLQRIYNHTKSQVLNKSEHAYFFSERHEFHYLTALRMFYASPLLGGGPNSFRYLCDQEPYSVNDLIRNNKNNIYLAKEDGYYYQIYYYSTNYNTFVYEIYLFNKEYYEKNNIGNYNQNLIQESTFPNKLHYKYLVYSEHILEKNNYKNFDFVKKDSLLFVSHFYKNGCNTHPHHIYIQFLGETGILGTIFLAIFSFFIYKSLLIKIINFIRKGINSKDIVIYGYYFSVFFPLIPSGNFFNNYYSILLYLPLTFIILCRRK
jgi:O-antigen ligase